jgi:hypothetical protein
MTPQDTCLEGMPFGITLAKPISGISMATRPIQSHTGQPYIMPVEGYMHTVENPMGLPNKTVVPHPELVSNGKIEVMPASNVKRAWGLRNQVKHRRRASFLENVAMNANLKPVLISLWSHFSTGRCNGATSAGRSGWSAHGWVRLNTSRVRSDACCATSARGPWHSAYFSWCGWVVSSPSPC